jgi:hypothetical protein
VIRRASGAGRGWKAAALAAAVLCCVPVAASASAFSGKLTIQSVAQTPAPDGSLSVGAQISLTQRCDAVFCGYYAFATTVPAAQACSPNVGPSSWSGLRLGDRTARLRQQLAATWRTWPATDAGGRRACLYASNGLKSFLLAQAIYSVPPLPGLPPPANPAAFGGADIDASAMPPSIGVRHAWPLTISTALVPPEVDPIRYRALATAAGTRWGLPLTGTMAAPARTGDGRDSVGFSRHVPANVLGITIADISDTFAARRVCRRVVRQGRATRSCVRRRGRLLDERVRERDTLLTLIDTPWVDGPELPTLKHWDLQTVLLHELGHYAGNPHSPKCNDSPMWSGLLDGDWWHTVADTRHTGCPVATGSARAAAMDRAPRMLYVVHRHAAVLGGT